MKRQLIVSLILLGTVFGCSGSSSIVPFDTRLSEGDQHVNWALTYFQSWKRSKQPRYLFLVKEHTIAAINEFFSLEQETSPLIREYFVVQDRRLRSCRMFIELQSEAGAYGFSIANEISDRCGYHRS